MDRREEQKELMQLLDKLGIKYAIIENAEGSDYTEIRLESDVIGFYDGCKEYDYKL